MTVRALVVGAGPSGLAAAAQLTTWCDSVTVAEARSRTRQRHVGEHLPPAGVRLLSDLGMDNLLNDPNHGNSCGVCSAWGQAEWAEKSYFFSPSGAGVNLRRDVFDEALASHATAQGAELNFGTRLSHLIRHDAGFEAVLRGPAGQHSKTVDVVIDASGRQARAARLLGARVRRLDRLVGIVGRVHGTEPTEDTGKLYIEAVENGWWYAVQFEDGLLICAFMTDADVVGKAPGRASDLWHESLKTSRILPSLAEKGDWSGRVDVFDAASQQLSLPEVEGFTAVGDAACAYDPLSSWGIAKGLQDGQRSGAAMQACLSGNPDILKRLKAEKQAEFARFRQRHNQFYRSETRWPSSGFWRRRQAELV